MLPSGAGPTCSTLPSPFPSSIGSSAVRGDVVACSSKLPFVHRLLFVLSRKVTTGSIWQDKHSMELKALILKEGNYSKTRRHAGHQKRRERSDPARNIGAALLLGCRLANSGA